MKRTPLARRTPLRRTPLRRAKRPHPDPVTPETYQDVRRRDLLLTGGWWNGCLGRLVVPDLPCQGPIELDHVRVGGTGLRSPSTRTNLASLCRAHHRYKTEHGPEVRPRLLKLIDP